MNKKIIMRHINHATVHESQVSGKAFKIYIEPDVYLKYELIFDIFFQIIFDMDIILKILKC